MINSESEIFTSLNADIEAYNINGTKSSHRSFNVEEITDPIQQIAMKNIILSVLSNPKTARSLYNKTIIQDENFCKRINISEIHVESDLVDKNFIYETPIKFLSKRSGLVNLIYNARIVKMDSLSGPYLALWMYLI